MENKDLQQKIIELENEIIELKQKNNFQNNYNQDEQQILLRSIIEIPDDTIVYAVDKNFNFLAFNNNYIQHIKAITDIQLQVGMNISEVLKKYKNIDNLKQEIKRALKGEEFFQIGDYLKNSQRIYYKDVYRPLYNSKNGIFGAIIYYIDITASTRSDKKWQLLLDIYEKVHSVANITELVSFIHSQLSELIDTSNFYVALYNEAKDIYSFPFYIDKYDEISKIQPQSLKKSLTDYVRRKGRPLLLSEYIDNELIVTGEVEMVGTPSPSWLGVPLKTNDKTIGVLVVQNYKQKNMFTEKDVELLAFISEHIAIALERKQFEQELKLYAENLLIAKDKAEESDKLKSAFLANMSHEIRTPLNAIIGFSKLLAKHDLSKIQREEYFTYIENSGNNLLNLINDIIDVAKIEAGQVLIKNSNCKINKILDEILETFNKQKITKEKENLDIILEKANPNINFNIFTDPNRFRQVISNLISNSLKFTDIGHIKFGYSYIDEKILKFFVEDTGIGIPENKIDIVFSRFGQIVDSEIRNPGGTGLGLSITKHLVEEMGGKIWFESKVGEGTTFFFTLPITEIENVKNYISNNTNNKENLEHDFSNLQILVVEDDIVNTTLLLDTLKLYEPKLRIDTASDGLEAVLKIKNKDYDIIIMDIRMPNLDGNEATKIIRKLPFPKNKIPIIGLSAHAMKEELNKSIEAGMNVFLTKPIVEREIINEIRNFTKNNNYKINNEIVLNENNNYHTSQIIDLSLLNEMYKNEKSKVDNILKLCLQNIPNQIIELEKSFYKEKWDTIKITSHTLKSTFNYLGSIELKEIAKKIEDITIAKINLNNIIELILQIKSIWNLAEVEVKKQLNL